MIELLNNLTDEGDPSPELFDFAIETITAIDSPDQDDSRLRETLLRFELKTLELLGHLPMLTKCVSCGREKTTMNRVSFGLNEGGILCKSCCHGKSNIVSLSADALQFLLDAVGGQIGADHLNSDNWNGKTVRGSVRQENLSNQFGSNKPEISESVQTDTSVAQQELTTEQPVIDTNNSLTEVRRLVKKYITHLLGFQPKLHKFLRNL